VGTAAGPSHDHPPELMATGSCVVFQERAPRSSLEALRMKRTLRLTSGMPARHKLNTALDSEGVRVQQIRIPSRIGLTYTASGLAPILYRLDSLVVTLTRKTGFHSGLKALVSGARSA